MSYSNKVDEKLVEYIDTSVVKYNSSTLFDRMHDNLKNINKNNIQSKMMDVLKVAAKQAHETISIIVKQLKNNKAIIAWAKDAELSSVDDAILANQAGFELKLGDSAGEITDKINRLSASAYSYY